MTKDTGHDNGHFAWIGMLICMLGCSITAAGAVDSTTKGAPESSATLLTQTRDTYNKPVRTSDLLPSRIRDGVMIQGGQELCTLQATWVVVVTLVAPQYPDGLRNILDRVTETQRSLRFYKQVQLSWKQLGGQNQTRATHRLRRNSHRGHGSWDGKR